jgi:hypothetical protein
MDGHSKSIRSGKTKEILYRAVNFLGEFLHSGYNFLWRNWEIYFLTSRKK